MSVKITLKELNVFQCIVKYKTVKAAANQLCITQSAASQALIKLESSFNTKLFDRHGRQLILNSNGHLLLPHAIQLLSQSKEIENLFLERPISITIGASTTIANYLMPDHIAHFRQLYPQAKLNMVVGNTADIIHSVTNFEIDIGFIEGSCSHADIQLTPWQNDQLTAVIAPHFTLSSQHYSLEQLRQLPWILRERGSGTRDKVEQFLTAHLGSFNLDMELGNSEAIKYAVAAGLGVSYLSTYVVGDLLKQQKVIPLTSDLPTLIRQFSIITHRSRQQTVGIASLLAVLESGIIG